MTLEIIVFIFAILFGILCYWTESKSNKLYRFFNKLTHSKELQMKADNRKGFIHKQPFLLRLVWISLAFLLAAIAITVLLPFTASYLQYFIAGIVGTMIGTYIASVVLFAQEKTKKESFEGAFEKAKDMVDDISEDIKDSFESDSKNQESDQPEPEEAPKKSARDRFKDKGMIK